jgi:hypothetical protein
MANREIKAKIRKIKTWFRWHYIKYFQRHRYQAPNYDHKFNDAAFDIQTIIDQIMP